MITKLTKKQKEKIPLYFEKWNKIGKEYQPINQKKAKEYLREYLLLINKKPTIFIKMSSPLGCQVAINKLKQLDKKLDNELSSELGSELDKKLYNELDRELGSELDKKLNKKLGNELYKKLYDELKKKLYDELGNELRKKLVSELDKKLYDELGRELGNELYYSWFYQCGNINAGYCAFYDFLIEEVKKPTPKLLKIWNIFKKISEHLHYFYCFDNIVFYSEKPITLKFNANNQLHNENGMAVEYADGWGCYSLNGVSVPEWLVTEKWNKIDPMKFAEIENAEIRREFVRKVGIERIVQKCGCEILDKHGDYELILVDLKGTTGKYPYLKMKNPSIGIWHLECVPQEIKTVEGALSWRNQTTLQPEQLT